MDWTDAARAVRIIPAPFAVVALLTACSIAGPRSSPLPQSGPTMEQIYRERAGEAERDRAREALPLRPSSDVSPGPVREMAMRQIERRFARLANPDLIMVVFPHLAQGKHPVPGYVTAFPMYERVEYLLPGEADTPRPASAPLQPTAAPTRGEAASAQATAHP